MTAIEEAAAYISVHQAEVMPVETLRSALLTGNVPAPSRWKPHIRVLTNQADLILLLALLHQLRVESGVPPPTTWGHLESLAAATQCRRWMWDEDGAPWVDESTVCVVTTRELDKVSS